MTNPLTLTNDDRGVATLTLNRPTVHNAFNAELIAELSAVFDRVAEDGTRILVLTGAGHSFFGRGGSQLDAVHGRRLGGR